MSSLKLKYFSVFPTIFLRKTWTTHIYCTFDTFLACYNIGHLIIYFYWDQTDIKHSRAFSCLFLCQNRKQHYISCTFDTFLACRPVIWEGGGSKGSHDPPPPPCDYKTENLPQQHPPEPTILHQFAAKNQQSKIRRPHFKNSWARAWRVIIWFT